MTEKYKNWSHFLLARLYRDFYRREISQLFSWSDPLPLEEGCTIVIGMCFHLPYVLCANLQCLQSVVWPDVREVIISVDALERMLPSDFEREIIKQFPRLNIRFVYYNEEQVRFAERTKLTYFLSWLSWVTALDKCRTKTALIHDYDALVFGGILGQRYQKFLQSKAAIQGVEWYKVNGFVPEDRLACTFEAFVDVAWVKSFAPLMIFNRVAVWKGRRVDFDSFLDVQANHTPQEKRTVVEMDERTLIHPTQMICEYTMARRLKGKPWHCTASTMIPFFYYLSGKEDFLTQVIQNIKKAAPAKNVDLLGNGDIINFYYLSTEGIDMMFRLMVQACLNLHLEPFEEIIEYIEALYNLAGVALQKRWTGDFTQEQREWIEDAKARAYKNQDLRAIRA